MRATCHYLREPDALPHPTSREANCADMFETGGRRYIGEDDIGNKYYEVDNPGRTPDPKREIVYFEKDLVRIRSFAPLTTPNSMNHTSLAVHSRQMPAPYLVPVKFLRRALPTPTFLTGILPLISSETPGMPSQGCRHVHIPQR